MMINTSPLVSICTITYNHADYISQALDSFLMQKTNFDFEIIVADDASEDNNQSIIRKFHKEFGDQILPVLRADNIGMQANWVDAISKCSGKYIALCEGDDYWTDPYKLQKQVDFLEANPDYGMVYTDIQMIGAQGEHLKDYPPYDRLKKLFKSGFVFWDLLNINFITTATTCLRADAIKVLFEESSTKRYTYDMYYWLQIAMDYKIKFINEITAAYRKHDGGITNTKGSLAQKRPFIYHDIVIKALENFKYQNIGEKGINVLFYKVLALLRNKHLSLSHKHKLLYIMIKYNYLLHFIGWAAARTFTRIASGKSKSLTSKID